MFAALAGAAERRLGGFNAQDLANTAWAFATASHGEELLFAAFVRVERRLGEFKAQELANTAWAVATLNKSDKLVTVLECPNRAFRLRLGCV